MGQFYSIFNITLIDELEPYKILFYLFYMKHKSKKRILLIIKEILCKVKELEEYNLYPKIECQLDTITKLLNFVPHKRLCKEDKLFPSLNDTAINRVYEALLPTPKDLSKILIHVKALEAIIHKWDPKATVRLFGSCANGFLLRNSSDIDLTILLPEKMTEHPVNYAGSLMVLLNKYTGAEWKEINSTKIYLLTGEYPDGTNVELLFNNITGLVNSEYVRKMAELDSRFHKVGYYLKYYVQKAQVFEKKSKLNSFSLMCMLIVYLQDVVKPPILPRIINNESGLSIKLRSPSVADNWNRWNFKTPNPEDKEMVTNLVNVPFLQDTDKILIEIGKTMKPNHLTCTEIFKGFIHYYFNGGGFDHVHDVIDTRAGKVRKQKDLLSQTEDHKNGVHYSIRKGLKFCVFPVLDPFDYSYIPSRGFSFAYKKNQLYKLQCLTSDSLI